MASGASSLNKTVRNGQALLYHSEIFSHYIDYLQSQHKDIDIDGLLDCSGLNRFEINDSSHFFSQPQIERFQRCLHAKLATKAISDKVEPSLRSHAIWKRMGAYAAMFSAVIGGAALFFLPAAAWTLLTLAMVVVCLCMVLVSAELKNKALTDRFQQQGNHSGHLAGYLLDEIDARCPDERLMVVDARFYARLQESEQRYRQLAEKATERVAIENKRQQAKKMESLGTMAGSIAHNFNNLLMVVSGNLELAKADLPNLPTAAGNIQRAINATQRAADLSNMMLTYVGQLKKESVPVDLSQMVNAVLNNMDPSEMANVRIALDLADPMPLVAADADQMRQMISGLITNAIEALGNEKGNVRAATGSMHCDKQYLSTTYLKEDMPEGMYAFVEVADTGCGMDAETLSNVFDPFFSSKFTGRGLGLAAVMGIIRSHGGAVKVSSVKNEGSVFTALFPIQGLSLRQDKPASAKIEMGATGKTVLLVDDEAMVMDIGSQFLKRLGYHVRTASSGPEAIDLFRHAPDHIDCLLLDFTMPGMDGMETMQQIKKIRPDVKIIITSGYTRQQIQDRFAGIGPPDDFLHKPFEMKALQAKLHAVISKAENGQV